MAALLSLIGDIFAAIAGSLIKKKLQKVYKTLVLISKK